MSLPFKRKAAFIDRDGVVNEERNYVYRKEDFVLLPGVVDGLRLLQEAGFLLIIVTNQSGISRGMYKVSDVAVLHQHLRNTLFESGVSLDGIYYCPHHPNGKLPEFAVECDCRKPAPGMILRAAAEYNIALDASVLIGDKLTDIQAGKRAGVGKTIIVESGHRVSIAARLEADRVVSSLNAAAHLISTEKKKLGPG